MTARADFADRIRAAVEAAVPTVSVVDFDAGQVKLPAVVIVNGSPMIELETLGGRIGWNLEAHCYSPALNSSAGLDALESLALAVVNAGIGAGYAFRTVSRPDITQYGAQDVLGCTVEFIHKLQQR